MAIGLLGPTSIGRPGVVYSTIETGQLGQERVGTDGNTYRYMKGISSLAAGDFVQYNGSNVTARTSTTGPTSGLVAVAPAAIDANTKAGWFLVDGRYATANVATHSAGAGKALFGSSTAGRLTTTPATEATVHGAFSDGDSASNVGPVVIRRAAYTGDIST